ncbi:MAG: helicase-related protein [Candidatus Malihini olakiniferum]
MKTKRNQAIKCLSDGSVNVLIANDVTACELDINNVSYVFNFYLPLTSNSYFHRILGILGVPDTHGREDWPLHH